MDGLGGVAGWVSGGDVAGWVDGRIDGQSLGGMGCVFCSSSTWLPPRKDTVCAGSGQELSQPTSLTPSTTLRGGRSHCFILDTRKPMIRECEEPAAFA